jgi:hypothetical protein
MLRSTLILVAAASLSAMVLTGCGVSFSDGPHTTEARSVGSFDRVEVRGSTNVTVRRGAGRRLTVEGGERSVAGVTTRVEHGTLIVAREDESTTIDFGGDDLRVTVTTPALRAARIDGSGDLVLPELDGGSLDLRVDGSGDVRAGGRLDTLDAIVGGSGDLHLEDVEAGEVVLGVSGSGDASVHPLRTLDVQIDGSGDVDYRGDPHVRRQVSGSGDLSRD